jgi:hypothetical protein
MTVAIMDMIIRDMTSTTAPDILLSLSSTRSAVRKPHHHTFSLAHSFSLVDFQPQTVAQATLYFASCTRDHGKGEQGESLSVWPDI